MKIEKLSNLVGEQEESQMSDEVKNFFSNKNRLKVIEKAVALIEDEVADSESDSLEGFVAESSAIILSYFFEFPHHIDKLCPINIKRVGESLIDLLRTYGALDSNKKELIFGLLYRFVLELQINSPYDIDAKLADILFAVRDYELSKQVSGQIKYADHQMIVEVLRGAIHHPDISLLRNLPEAVARSESERDALEKALAVREARVKALEEALKKHETAFNFVGLNDGFKKLRDTKAKESKIRLAGIFFLGVAMVAPFLGKIYMIFNPIPGVVLDLYSYISLFALELILALFFRVALHGRRSIEAQLVQLDLRMALCQFVQGYTEYASEVRKKDASILDRFDQLIFSGIVTNESAIPSSFDGVEQIAGLLAKMKDSK